MEKQQKTSFEKYIKHMCPEIVDAYKRYERDLEENIYKVGNIFYTLRSGYGSPGKRVIITKVDVQYFPNKEDGILAKTYTFKECTDSDKPSRKDLGAMVSTVYNVLNETDSRLVGMDPEQKRLVTNSSIYELLGIYSFLMPLDEFEKRIKERYEK